jgi:hypothetical protein
MPALHPPTPAPPPHAAAAAFAPASVPRYGFADAWMGMTLDQWRSSRPARAKVLCGGAPRDPAAVICRGADTELGGGYGARDLSYVFVDDRLARISFRTSIDGFAFVTSALKRSSGPPDQIMRDSTGAAGRPHVSMVWRNGRSTIVLSDPLPDFSHLSVNFTLDSLANRLPKAG